MIRARADSSSDVAVMTVSPVASARTSPHRSTDATDWSADDQATVASPIGMPAASRTSAASRTVSPIRRVARAGVTAIQMGTATTSTVTSAVPVASPALAVIVALPSPAAVTSPEPSTVATASSPDSHENSAASTACPFASNAAAVNRSVSPTAASVASFGATDTESGDCATVTSAVPVASPALAVIVALPSATAVTSPEPSTVATCGLSLAQATDMSVSTSPF